ncbi:MAG: hypothetical protein JWO03_3324 [Bacteroidetes bacterium]|nr:hypothetical protein [Bacteroidota bacterium]
MEGNPNDKALREKLQAAEYPYDPAAWGQMEKMLDGKKKRRGIFWWSALGVTASLLLGAAVYVGIQENIGDKNTLVHSKSSRSEDKQQENKVVASKEQQAISASGYSVDQTQQNSGIERNTKTTQPVVSNHSSRSYSSLYQQTASIERPTIEQRPVLSIPEIEQPGTTFNTISSTCLYDDLQDPAPIIPLKHRHKSSIHYQLGIASGIYEAFAAKTFGNKPAWAFGLSQELQIGKYFAITNSILYSEVNFRINNPKYPDNNYLSADNYSSHIREIAIPIGIKVYPYSSKLIKIGIGISYVNHVKLKETFDYKTTPKQVNTGVLANQSVDFPALNDFTTPDPTKAYTPASMPPRANVVSDYYSIGNGRRYYGSLAYTAGAEFLLPKHFSIAAEPCLMMSLDKIKMQNTRVFDFGMNAGVKYTF